MAEHGFALVYTTGGLPIRCHPDAFQAVADLLLQGGNQEAFVHIPRPQGQGCLIRIGEIAAVVDVTADELSSRDDHEPWRN
jgi:hypothetical protein